MDTRVRLPLRLGIPLAALAVGFAGAVLYVPLALEPMALRAEAIQHNLAESVRALTELRGAGRDLRTEALLARQAQWDASIDRDARVGAVAHHREQIQDLAAAYARLPRTADEDAIWREVRERRVPDLDRAVARALAARSRPGSDPGAVQVVLDAGASMDVQIQRLVQLNAEESRAESALIHRGMRRLSIAYVVLAVLGAVGGLLLVPQIVRVLRSHAEAVGRRVEELEAFAGQISHDLRSPLQAVQLAVAMVERRPEDGASVRRFSAKAMSGVRRLDRMIQELLQFARSGAETRESERCDVPALVDELARELGPEAEQAHVAFTVRAEPGVVARIAPIALKTVLSNLVGNAIKYRRPDGDNRVEVDAASNGDRVRVRVEDTGIGIAPAALPRIFEPFFRATRRPDSHGLGLSTVKRLVEAHRGTISVRSNEGRGTTFLVDLPRASSRESQRVEGGREDGAGAPLDS